MTGKRAAAARRLAAAAQERGDPVGWFEELYAAADQGGIVVPWAEYVPNPHLVGWDARGVLAGSGRRALVVGCGFGDDAEYLAGLGFDVTAFDVSPTAVATAASRFPGSAVTYTVADVLAPPAAWWSRFDLVFEAYTVQVHQGKQRVAAMEHIAGMVAGDGTLLVVAHAREEGGDPGRMPWPLTRAEVDAFAGEGMELVRLDMLYDDAPPGPRWRAEFVRSAPADPGDTC
ncbi:class I SAM-dependent methyltransferase [Streptomyces sp. BK205]|uniref:class I SAM-dependent methyltransferase n=1 Tax=Streptomyces sp. BK205 TaxID=2512164 RepID=UPI001045CA2F|nr:class I SAM-dependent methyltransferase [Streptomyces sp. BK205]TCR16052.1 methyltransferase family protein [Streptomyces sp. BK205]